MVRMTTLFPSTAASASPLAVTLRPYQQAAIDALYQWFNTNRGNPLVVVPTGGGKSLVIAGFVHSVLSQWPKERIIILTHVRELIAQNHAALLRAWPGAPAGIYSAGLGRREHDAPILFAGIQSCYEKAGKIGWADLVLIDEAHLVPAKGMGMYQRLLTDLRSMNPHLKVIGLTATPYRTDSGSLDAGEERMFHGTAFDCDLVQLIRDGYLSAITSKGTKAAIDTSSVHVRGGEFIESELQHAAMAGDNVQRAVTEVVSRGTDRKSWLLFCCGIDHANAVADEMQRHGIACATVFGETPKQERDQILADYKANKIRAIANVGVLTTGFDAPATDLVVLLRPTMSPGLYVQMTGRGLRTAPGKKDALVLDFGGNVMRHGPIDCVRVRQPGKKDEQGMVPARECPNCQTIVGIMVRECPECGYVWVVADGESGSKHDDKPAEQEIIAGLARANTIERWDVHRTFHRRNEKEGKAPTLCVEYHGGFKQLVREWVCFEHPLGSFPRTRSAQWWASRGGHSPTPESVDLAMVRIENGELRRVVGVIVDTRGQWPELRGVKLEETEAGAVDFPDANAAAKQEPDEIPF